MKLLVALTLCVGFYSSLLHAQTPAVGDQRRVIPATRIDSPGSRNASFAIGLTRDQGITFRNEARAPDALRISARVQPEPQHVGKTGDIFALAVLGGAVQMLTSDGQLLPWDGTMAGLRPVRDDVTLQTTMDLELFSGVVGSAGTFPFYLAYRENSSGDFNYTATPESLLITNDTAPTQSVACAAYGGRTVNVGYTSAQGVFTHAPFRAQDLAMITNGEETNDARFSYQWIKRQGERIDIYAPADGVLVRLRHKTENLPIFPSDDFDLFFLVACDPARPGSNDVIVRFNHITDPRPDIKAAYGFGSLGAPVFTPAFEEREDRQVPLVNIAVKAGDYLGSTSGTPTARDFDFQIGINDVSVCPFSVLNEPHRSDLLALLGPQSATPFGPSMPGYACRGYGARP
ncbi:MAG: hypothetical protein Q7V56_16070 [Gammaproteobacteria bacterium]|nr:hypothetical protein [Gammaproteobacteria bacterium]